MLIVNTWLFFSLVYKGWWDMDRMIIDYFARKKPKNKFNK